MSRQPSPGPSQPAAHHNAPRQKPKPHATGIAAGAEDAKYKAKYRDLKKRVKEIEGDNDKLYFKTLQAKRNIQRMRIERAILYERLSSHPASPHLLERQGYAHAHPAAPPPHPHQQRHHPHEHAYPPQEYYRSYDGVVRVVSDDGRALHAHAPPPHHARHPQQQPQPLPTQTQTQHLEPPRAHRSASHSHSHSHSPSAGSHSHSRSRSRGQYAPPHPAQLPQGYVPPEHEQLPPAQLHPADRGRVSDARSPPHRERVHNHQRVGPGAHISAYAAEDRERERELEWEREQERRVQARGREERQFLDVRAPGHAASRSATPRSRSGSVGAHPAAGESRKRARSEEGDGEDEE